MAISKQSQIKSTLVQFYSKPIAQVSLELFLSVGTVIFFALFAIRPTLLTMADLVKEIEDKRKLEQQLLQKQAALNSVQSEYLSLQGRLGVLDEAIPDQPKINEALKIIEKLASENQVVIQSMHLQEMPKDSENVAFSQKSRISLPVSTTVLGDYASIRNFIASIQQTRRTMIVDSISFAVNEERTQKKLKATVTINLQYFGVQEK